MAIGASLGAIAGFIYYYFWGCKNGCPLQSNWIIMTFYGAFAGLILATPSKKKKKDDEKSK
jgi:hypothetical protein